MLESSILLRVIVRVARREDAESIASMVDDFVKGHPAQLHPRSLDELRAAYFGPNPVAEIVVAEREDGLIGMGQWTRIYDMFWSMFGGRVDWLYVRPEARGRGVAIAILAAIGDRVRRAGGEFLAGQGNDETTPLYERCAIAAGSSRDCHLSAEAFQVLADLAGRSPREIVGHLPEPTLNRVPARPRPHVS
jgi:GNAT superfamily N-acetyltransferase